MKDLQDYGINVERTNRAVNDLLMSSLRLAEIMDQPIDKNGMIYVRYTWVAERFFSVQQNARDLAGEWEWIKEGLKEITKEQEKDTNDSKKIDK